MDQQQGEITKPIGGRLRTFKFGMNSSRLLSSEVDLTKIAERPFDFIPYLFWAGLKVRESVNDLPAEFTVDTVCDWMDAMSEEDAAEVYVLAEGSLGFISRMMQLVEEKKNRLKTAA